jgi:hypothetical protein
VFFVFFVVAVFSRFGENTFFTMFEDGKKEDYNNAEEGRERAREHYRIYIIQHFIMLLMVHHDSSN